MDDADRAAEIAHQLATRSARDGVPPEQPLTITYFSCRMGTKETEVPSVLVLERFVDQWLALDSGWKRGEQRAGKVTLHWRGKGEPVKPRRA